MGGAQSIDLPGGGTEGYHVLRVSDLITLLFCFIINIFLYISLH